jgi:hypothetical protein
VNVDHTSITLGNGDCTVNLTGEGHNAVKTGSGNDVIHLSGTGNWVDAGAADTFDASDGNSVAVAMSLEAYAAYYSRKRHRSQICNLKTKTD